MLPRQITSKLSMLPVECSVYSLNEMYATSHV